MIAAPVLRANVTVTGDVVRIGDVIDNAGTAAQIAIYRAPDLGTTGTLPTAQVLSALRAHQVIGVDTRDITDVSVTRLARTLEAKDIETAGRPRAGTPQRPWRCRQPHADLRSRHAGHAARRLQHRRDPADRRPLRPAQRPLRRHASRSATTTARADASCASPAPPSRPSKPRCWPATSNATTVLKSSDVVIERRPKAEVGPDAAVARPRVGMQTRRQLARRSGAAHRRSGQARPGAARPERHPDLPGDRALPHHSRQGDSKAAPKATSSTCSTCNRSAPYPASSIGRGQVSISVATPRLPPAVDTASPTRRSQAARRSVAASDSSPVSPKAE